MRVALIFNPFSYKLHEENIRIVQKYFGLFPPLSLAWVAAIAKQAGHEVILVDARTIGLSKEQTLEILKDFQPDILGFMMTTYMFRETLDWARVLKNNLKIPVLAGGYNLRVYPRESLMNDVVDYGCYYQAIRMIPDFLAQLEGNRDFDIVPGLIYKKGHDIVVNPPHPNEEDFDAYPNPARELLPNELYAEFPTERKNFTVMVTSLGCPKQCSFCEARGTKYAARKPETVVNEIEECYYKYSIREIDIFDYEFCISNERVKNICEGIINRNLDITWACRARIDSVNEDLLEIMHRAGCRRIYYGIESGDQQTLSIMNKDISIGQIKDTIGKTNEIGIKTLGFFLVGVPGETIQSFRDTVNFAMLLNLSYAQFSKLTAKPWTLMWNDLIQSTGEDYWKEYILGRQQEKQLPRPWTEISNIEIDRLTKWAYLKFYMRPKYLWKAIKSVASFTEFKRKFMALLDMLFGQEKASEDWIGKSKQFTVFNENSYRIRKKHITERNQDAGYYK
ncbi:MAG TPA: radical SAM protein [bacterium]|nr:radical SAM protein [bacterium]